MTDLLAYPFFQRAVLAVALLSVVMAVTGVYVMSRRMLFVSGGVTHACFGGLGLGYLVGVSPVGMAAVFAVASSLGVQWISRSGRVRTDSAIAVIWAVGMALGVLFIFMGEGYVPQLNTFLFGNVLTVSASDLWIFGVFTAVLVGFFLTLRRTIEAVSFDPDFSRVSHLPVAFIDTAMTLFTALAIVLSIRLVGIMLLISLLSLPPVIAETMCRRYSPLVLLSTAIALGGSLGGLAISAWIGVPASASIVLLLAFIFLVIKIIPGRMR